MEPVKITRKDLKQMQILNLGDNVYNTESTLYYIREKGLILKRFNCEGRVLRNKIYTINMLDKYRELFNMPELVLPARPSLARFFNETYGMFMPYIPNLNLDDILNSSHFTIKEKVNFLKEVGLILEKLKKVRCKIPNFYLNDIHESNFIVNKETKKINVIDLDSARIGDNEASASKYLNPIGLIIYASKYKEEQNFYGGYYKIDENTEIYSYIMMILQFFYGDNIIKMNLKDYWSYLEYMARLNISKELIDTLSLIVQEKDNINPYELIAELVRYYYVLDEATFNKYLHR